MTAPSELAAGLAFASIALGLGLMFWRSAVVAAGNGAALWSSVCALLSSASIFWFGALALKAWGY